MKTKQAMHTPGQWIKTVMQEATRTPQEVAIFAGPNARYVERAINSYEELFELLKNKPGTKTTAEFNWNWNDRVKQAIARAEGK